MYLRKTGGRRVASLPGGRAITRADLPPPGTTRWVASRKAAVVLGVQSGLITQGEAFRDYDLSEEEFAQWVAGATVAGREGLRATRRAPLRASPQPPMQDGDDRDLPAGKALARKG